jgi:hypothetical protein
MTTYSAYWSYFEMRLPGFDLASTFKFVNASI